jgi:2-iminobutanoate/2-iminopropanoate deaminase
MFPIPTLSRLKETPPLKESNIFLRPATTREIAFAAENKAGFHTCAKFCFTSDLAAATAKAPVNLEFAMTRQHFGSSHVPLSPAVRAGDFIFVSGQVPTGSGGAVVVGGIEAQTQRVLENVEAALKLAGASLADVVKTTVILVDARDFAAFNKVYATYFRENPPARTTLEARLMIDIRIEFEAVAYKPL